MPRQCARLVAAARSSLATAIVAAVVVIGNGPANTAVAAAPACSTENLTLTSAQGTDPIFYTDPAATPSLDSAYVGWKVTNGTGVPRSDLWVRLADWSSPGPLTLGINVNEDNAYPLGELAAGDTGIAYTFVTASGISTDVQNYKVQVFSGDPRLASSTQVCEDAASFKRVDDTIQANANKVTGTLVGPNPPGVGGVVTLTVYGQGTGQMGAGPGDDPSVFWMTPAAVSTWKPNAYKLVSAQLTIDPDGNGGSGEQTYLDQLRFNTFSGGSRPYTAVYRFVVIGVTSGSTSTYPVQNIASGVQVKHTTLSGYETAADFPPIAPADNVTTVSYATPSTTIEPGDAPFTVSVHAGDFGTTVADANGDGDTTDPGESTVNTGLLDSLRVELPAGASFTSGTAQWDGVSIGDPVLDGTTLVFPGPFLLGSNSSTDLTFSTTFAAAGTYDTWAWATIGSTDIDTTLDTTSFDPAALTVTARSNTAPVVTGGLSGTGDEDTDISATLTGTDADFDSLSWTVAAQPTNGTAVIADPLTGTWVYTPDADWSGTDTFDVQVSDGNGGFDTATVTVTVDPVNDDPTITGGLTGTSDEDTNVTGTATSTDIDGGTPTWTVTAEPTNGSATIDPATGAWTYTPDADWSGTDTFDIQVDDSNGGVTTETVAVTVTPVNDDPAITGGLTGSSDEDTDVTGTAISTDIDGADPTWTVTTAPATGTATIDPTTGVWIFTPNANWSGTTTFIIEVSDGNGGTDTATVTITVTSTNDAPVITGGLSGTSVEDTDITGTATSTDIDGAAPTWTVTAEPTNGSATIDPTTGEWTYTPDADWSGTDTFDIQVSDGNGGTDTATVTVTVDPVNDDPTITGGLTGTSDEDTDVTGTATSTDTDGDTPTWTITTQPSNGTATINPTTGLWVYTPVADWSGTDTFEVQVSDGNGGTDTATVTVTVDPVNDDPVEEDPTNGSVNEDPTNDDPVASVTSGGREARVLTFFDRDGNGTRDAGEEIVTSTVTMTSSSGSSTGSTGADHMFSDMAAGDWTVTASATGFGLAVNTMTLAAGAEVTFIEVPLTGTANLTGIVGRDVDGDGIADQPLPNESLTVTWSGPDGIAGTADDISFDATTDAAGTWKQSSMPAGGYTVTHAASSTDDLIRVDTDQTANSSIVLAAPPTPAPSPTTTPPPTPRDPDSAQQHELPVTGSETSTLLLVAVTLGLLGLVLTRFGRRRSL